MSGMLILIKGNDILAQNNVTRILPVRLKVKLKTTFGHRMPNDWQFTSMITITVTYPRKGVRCAVCGGNTFIAVFYCILFVRSLSLLLIRVTPSCALTFVVYENVIYLLLPNRRHRQDKQWNPAMGSELMYNP